MLKYYRLHKKWIASFWTALMLVSLAMIFFHNHHHQSDNEGICLHEKGLAHSQDDQTTDENCHYCFLFYHQITDQVQVFFWESKNQEIIFKPLLFTLSSIKYTLELKYTIVQRGPPEFIQS